MGFYGNITNTSKTNFVFDKIYTNRKAMDSNISKDGIFIGRYVLVEYGEITEDSFIRAYGPQTDGYYHTSDDNKIATRILYTTEPIPSKDNYIKKGQIIYVLGIGGKYRFLECNGGINKGKPTFAENPGLDPKTDPYFYNLKQDQTEYNVSRGYDGTVWVKTSVNNEIKYVNIAELNSVVPSFEMVADAPTISPILPHFDTASNNVYYKLHWQPTWGMRIAETTNGSDNFSDYVTSWSQEVYNKETGETFTHWYFPEELQEDKITKGVWRTLNTEEQPPTINADIYFNKAAFDSQVGETIINKDVNYKPITLTSSTYVKGKYYYKSGNNYLPDNRGFNSSRNPYYEKLENYIGITADGLSGNKYNRHDGTSGSEPQVDTQQIHINLPAIGNMMSEAWDIIHGKQRNDYRGDGENASLQGRLDAFGGIEKNQIPIKRNDGTIIGSKINNGIDFNYQGNDSKEILDELIATIPEGKKSLAHNDPWIKVNVDTTDLEGGTKIGENPSQANNNGVLIQHTFHSTENSTSTLDMNSGDNTASINTYKKDYLNVKNIDAGKENDDIKLYSPYVDKAGHVVGYNEETITLPYGFKTITAENSTKTGKWSQEEGEESSTGESVKNIVADNTKDTFNFKGGNKWIRFQTDASSGDDTDNDTKADGNNILTIAHETHDINTTPLNSDFNVDSAFKYIKVELDRSTYSKGKYYFIDSDNKYKIDESDQLVSGREYFIVNDKIAFQDLKFDIAGHVTDNQIHTYTLPYGYKYFETNGLSNEHKKDLYTKNADNEAGNSEEKDTEGIVNKTEAHNTQDLLAINPANKWIQTQFVDNDGRQDELVIAHEIHSIDERDSENGDKDASNKGTSHTNPNKETGATNEINLTMYDWSYDKAGHITSKRKHTYTLPFGYKTFTDGTNNSIANSTQDTFKFIGDSWLKPTVANDQITYTHIGPVNGMDLAATSASPKFKGTFDIITWGFDELGHKNQKNKQTITLPTLTKEDNDINSTGYNLISNIEFIDDDSQGQKLQVTRKLVGEVPITNYALADKSEKLNASDTINQAFGKLQAQINALDLEENSSTTQFISKISQVDGKVTVERAAAGTLQLGTASTDGTIPADSSLNNAFNITNVRIKAEEDALAKEIQDRQDAIDALTGTKDYSEHFNTMKEIADWLDANKDGVVDITLNVSANATAIGNEKTRAEGIEAGLQEQIDALGTASTKNIEDFATSAQGVKADTAAATIATYGDIVTYNAEDFVLKSEYNALLSDFNELKALVEQLNNQINPPQQPDNSGDEV